MASNSWTKVFDTFVTSTLDDYTAREFVDNVFVDIPLFDALRAAGNYLPQPGGNDILVPIQNAANSTAGAVTLYEELDMSPPDIGTAARYQWAQYTAQVVISDWLRSRNKSRAAIIDMVRGLMMNAESSLRDQMSADIFSTGDGTDGKTLIGLQRMIPGDPTTYSVGGIAASDTTWRNQYNTGGVVFNTSNAGEIAMSGMANDTSRFGRSRRPKLIITTYDVAEKYETEIREAGRTPLPAKLGDSGIERLSWRGIPVVPDGDCSGGTMYFIDTTSLKLRYDPDFNFKVVEKDPANQLSSAWVIAWSGQLVCDHRRSQGVITTIT